MAYRATVLPVMIASPSDVHVYRGDARNVIHEWNYVRSLETGIVLMPVGWDTHSSPELGSSPQDLINDRVLEECDLLVGIFWTRLGTPTQSAESGTAEEIRRHVQSGKPAMLYFCTAPVSLETVDPVQWAALSAFKAWCQTQGLVETVTDQFEFREKLRRQLEISLQKNALLRGQRSGSPQAIDAKDVSRLGELARKVQHPMRALALALVEEARDLLLKAATSDQGSIFVIHTLDGLHISVSGGEQIDLRSDARRTARYEHAIRQLVDNQLLLPQGRKNQVFQVSDRGYALADYFAEDPEEE